MAWPVRSRPPVTREGVVAVALFVTPVIGAGMLIGALALGSHWLGHVGGALAFGGGGILFGLTRQ